jgi:p-aminobenzoyl-glutamate transporter AbgT
MLKVIIVILFFAVVASLFSGLNFLVKDLGDPKKRLLRALGIRISLAAALLLTIIYGAYTGQIKSQAPWDREMHPSMASPGNLDVIQESEEEVDEAN